MAEEIERLINEMEAAFHLVCRERPLVHMISSYVTGALCADAISAVGGRPLMAQAKEEMEEITASADGLAVNLGQPSEEKYQACSRAMKTAASLGLPVLLDPVGAGASEYRRTAAAGLFSIPWSGVVKGNGSERHTVLTGAMTYSGVDSVGEFSHEEEAGLFLSSMRERGRAVVLAETGAVDKILWLDEKGGEVQRLLLGHEAERRMVMVGTGCMAGAILGTLLAAEHKSAAVPLRADKMAVLAAAAISMVSFCCEREAGDCGYGTYKTKVLDALSVPDWNAYRTYLRESCQLISRPSG